MDIQNKTTSSILIPLNTLELERREDNLQELENGSAELRMSMIASSCDLHWMQAVNLNGAAPVLCLLNPCDF
jgi:hypothetical protein